MKSIRILIIAILFIALPAVCHAATLELGSVTVKNVGINKRLIRLNDSGLIIEDSGLCLEVSVDYRSYGLAGSRVICLIHPLDAQGNMLSDRTGDAVSLGAVTIPSSSYNGTLVIPLPYQWVLADGKNTESIKMGVSLVCVGNEDVDDNKIVTLSGADIQIDKNRLGNKMMSDFMGSSGDMMGDMLGSLLGGSDVESTGPCVACDGTGICPHCDGDAYFNPSSCRKCSSDPGICRRCKGKGTTTIEYNIY